MRWTLASIACPDARRLQLRRWSQCPSHQCENYKLEGERQADLSQKAQRRLKYSARSRSRIHHRLSVSGITDKYDTEMKEKDNVRNCEKLMQAKMAGRQSRHSVHANETGYDSKMVGE